MTIKTNNEAWGFFGTLVQAGCTEAEATEIYHNYAHDVLCGKYGLSESQAVDFLDSRAGRHLCDCFCYRGGVRIDHEPRWLLTEIRRSLA